MNRYHAICAFIAALLLLCCPSAISRFVRPLIIWPTIQRFAGWSLSHINQEIAECFPSLADSDSSSTIVRVLFVPRICASLNHVLPRYVSSRCWFLPAHVAVPVNHFRFGNGIGSQTTTRFGSTGHQISCSNTHFISAVTSAFAKTSDLGIHEKSSKAQADRGMFSRHNGGHFTVLFSSEQPESLSECSLRFYQNIA